MIEWIALAASSDANANASRAREEAEHARHDSQPNSAMVVIKPVKLIDDPSDLPPEGSGFFKRLFYSPRKILDKKPFITFSISKHHIENLTEYEDDAESKYVVIKISRYAKVDDPNNEGYYLKEVKVPGSIEKVARAISGV
jgi:hypothetical protein